MAVHQSVKKLLLVEEWIDGATIHRSGVDSEAATGFAWSLYDHIFKLFSKILPLAPNFSPHISKREVKALKESLGNLLLWGDGFRDGKLEMVLEESDELKETVIESLVAAGSVLISIKELVPSVSANEVSHLTAADDQDIRYLADELGGLLEKARTVTESDLESDNGAKQETESSLDNRDYTNPIHSLQGYVRCLMDLLPSMEDVLAYATQGDLDDKASTPVQFQVSGPAQTYILYVYDRFPKADSQLVERLGEANWQRHLALRTDFEEHVNVETDFEVKFSFIPVSLFQDSGLGSSLPAQTSYAATAASHSSFVSSNGEAEPGRLQVPPTPKGVFEGTPFICEICGHELSEIKNRVDWKRHVFADLKPYICTFSGCKMELKTFPTRKMWEEHEFNRHREKAGWGCPECPSNFPTLAESYDHLEEFHKLSRDGQQFHNVAQTIVRRQPDFTNLECPLCMCIPGESRRNFVTHVGKHMEGIALATLPRGNASDSDSDSDLENFDTESTHRSHSGNSSGTISDRTGREPGRWPKDMIKKDLGNADSWPGLKRGSMTPLPLDSKPKDSKSKASIPSDPPLPIYPLPIPAEKLEKALRLYKIYKAARYEEELMNRQLGPSSTNHGYYLSVPGTPRPRSPTPRTSSQRRRAESVSISADGGVTDISSVISFDGNESPSKSKTELSTWDGKKVKPRKRQRFPKATKAKSALICHLGSCWACHKRRVTCDLEQHHDVKTLERLLKSKANNTVGSASQDQATGTNLEQT